MYRFHLFGKISNLKFNSKLLILYLAGFILIMATSLPAYINSSFLENFVGAKNVGFFFVAANIFTFFAMLFFPRIIRSFGNFFVAKIILLINIVSLMVLMMSPSSLFLFIFFISMWAASNLIWINMDIFVESFTSNTSTGKVRAMYFTFINIGWAISPTITSRLIIANDYYNLVYLVAAFAILIFYFIILKSRKKIDIIPVFDNLKIKDVIVDYWQNLNLRGIYLFSFFHNLFLSSVVVFVPVYLHTVIGFSWSDLGIMFSIMLLPFVIVEIPAGIIADKYIGEKEMTFLGFAIITISLLLFFFVKSTNPFIWGTILFFSRVGAALVEAMRESRFFKIVDVENVSHINFLRTSYPLGYLIGSALGVLILSFYEIQYLFIFLAVLFLFSFYFVYIIKDSK